MGVVEEHLMKVTSKGQVTIPADIRNLLGIEPGGEVIFRVADGKVEILPPSMTLDEVYKSVPPINRPEDFEELRRIALDEHSEKVLEEMKGQ